MAKRSHVIDLTLSDDDEVKEIQPAAKVARIVPAPTQATAPIPSRTDLLRQDTPFKLMKIRDGQIPAAFNFGCLGADLNLLLPGPMEFVMVSNMQVDLPWLLSACPGLHQAKHLLVCHGEKARRAALLQEAMDAFEGMLAGGGRIQLHAPPVPNEYGSHHSKAFIVKFELGLRVIILTANMVQPDCTVKTQGLWCQDFPPKDAQSPSTSPFESDLTDYIKHLKLPQPVHAQVLSLVAGHDMSSARVALVPSVPGWHSGANMRKYGHMRLRDLLSREPLPTSDWVSGSHLLLQCSSLGSLDDKWLTQQMTRSLSAAARTGPATSPQLGAGLVAPSRIHFVWPTVQEVRNSLEGWAAGGSIPGPKKNVEKPFLQRHMACFGGQSAGRQRAMPHIKSYCRFLGQQMAWVVLGSHNLSKAAWGMLCQNDSTLKILSYELSLLFTPSLEAAYLAHRHSGFNCTAPRSMSGPGSSAGPTAPESSGYGASGTAQHAAQAVEFWSMEHLLQQAQSAAVVDPPTAEGGAPGATRVMMPLPYKLPPQHYNPTEDKPWMVDVNYPGVDILGHTLDELYGGG